MPRKKKGKTTFRPPEGWTVPANEEMRRRLTDDPQFLEECRDRMAHARSCKKPRYGVTRGMNRKDDALAWRRARRKATKFIEMLKDEGILPDVIIPNDDTAKADKALHETCVIAFGPGTTKDRLTALKVVLEYTKSKPESKSSVKLSKSEDFLAAIAKELEDGK